MTQVLRIIAISSVVLASGGPLSSLAQSANGLPKASTRPWPLPTRINLTSSFGEYRSGHLHAGLDIKTYGKEGIPCRAVGDGYVSRMRASPVGYGKAVYLKLASGETVVYAHLSEFAPHLEATLYEEQVSAGRYRVDVHFEADRFPVTQGQVIAYTGRTGASAPHLHFEVRDEGENPINPLSTGWQLEDESAPEFNGAIFFPLSRHSRVGGQCSAEDVKLTRLGAGRYLASDTLVLTGRNGMAVRITDRLNGTSGRLAPYNVEMSVEGVLLSSITFERFTYSHTGEVELAYHMGRVRRLGEHYLFLFRRSGESLWNRRFVNDGVIDTEALPKMVGERKDLYTVVVRTTDRAGNVSVALVPFRVGDVGTDVVREVKAGTSNMGGGEGLAGCYFFDDLMAVTPGVASVLMSDGSPVAALASGDGSQLVFKVEDFAAESPSTEALDLVFSGTGSKLHFLPLRRGQVMLQELSGLGVTLVAADRSLYGDTFLYVGPWDGRVEDAELARRGLSAAASPIQLGPLSVAFRAPIRVRYELSDAVDGREAVYRLHERKKQWMYEGAQLAGDTLIVELDGPGIYGVFVDTYPPRIAPMTIEKRRSHATGDVYNEVVIPIDDVGSGLDDDRTVILLDGRKRISRWDGFTKRMFVHLRDIDLTETKNVSVIAVDRVGNEARVTRELSQGHVK